MPHPFRRLAAVAALAVAPAALPAQPTLTDVTLWNATFQGAFDPPPSGTWNTRPADGAPDIFLSPDPAAAFNPANVVNPGATLSLPLAVGTTELFWYASSSFSNFLGMNLFFDGAAAPGISIFFSFGTGTDPNSAACTLTPTLACTPGAGTLSFATGGYTVTLQHLYLADAAENGGSVDRVGLTTLGADGTFDNHGRIRLTVAQAVVPEPSTWLLVATGALGLAAVARRRRR